jgi:uncharacterized membrane protein (DUF2068 family)
MAKYSKWNLRTCATVGHTTYKPDETDLAEKLHASTAHGEAWLCLRCGHYIVGEPLASGPAINAPEVPRGKLLRDLRIMRLLAVEKFSRALLLILAAVGIWYFKNSQQAFSHVVAQELPLLRPAAKVIGWNIDQSWIVKLAHSMATTEKATLILLFIAFLAYAALQIGEAVGLWLAKRWGEYLAVIGTSAFIPIEIHELIISVTPFKTGILVFNIIMVLWLLISKRLFGIRGGHAAHVAEHQKESLLTITRAINS